MSIEVHVRIRPNVPNSVWSSAETVLYSTHNPNTRYVYNKVHHIGTTNQAIFHGIEALVHAGFDGKNVTVMAYGQTGSGKTHSMNGTESDPGVVPCTAKLLLDLRKNYPGTQIVAYFTEIYNESVKDLLEPQRGELTLHDAPDGGVVFDKKSVPIETMEDFLKFQNGAERNRKYGVTNLNDHSSRSHTILTFEIIRLHRQASTINLVDLAGSESASRANTDGVLLREGGFINKSLLTLGNVVDAIVEKRSYVPYRDAKLTRILRNCLGGSGMTFILCCVNPSHENFEQTVSSLRFTQRAMKIKNDPVMILNMPPLFAHQYSAGAAELVDNLSELSETQYQRGLCDAFMYTTNTMSSVVTHFDGQVSDSLHAMANTQRLLIAHDHAMGIEQIGRLYSQLHEINRQDQQNKEIEADERKRQREAVDEIEMRQLKITRLEAELKGRDAEADTELAGWEYQLYEAHQRRVAAVDLLLAAERARRCRMQYEWAVCVERMAARCVPAIKALGPVTPPVADKSAVLKQMRQRLLEAREELAELTVAHDMIKGDLPHAQLNKPYNAEEDMCRGATKRNLYLSRSEEVIDCDALSEDLSQSLSPQPQLQRSAVVVVAAHEKEKEEKDDVEEEEEEMASDSADIDARIRRLEREEKALMSRAVYAARCESTRRIRESLRQPRSRTPPTTRSFMRRGTPTATTPPPRTARTIFSVAEAHMTADGDEECDVDSVKKDELLADGVRRALGVLRDVRSKLMRPAQQRRRSRRAASPPETMMETKTTTTTPAITITTPAITITRTPTPPRRQSRDEDMTVLEMYRRMAAAGGEAKGAVPIGIAARRRMEGAPVRPNVERALWRLSLSPVAASMEAPERSRSRRR